MISYYVIGNLITDDAEGIDAIDWTVYGKIAHILKGSDHIYYTYDAAGNRISKIANGKTTIYVRDASGNVMSIYEAAGEGDPVKTEDHLYGSSRIGIANKLTVAPEDIPFSESSDLTMLLSTFTRGEKNYELSNHLGNVLVTITDKKIRHSASIDDYYGADVVSAVDYFPFGMTMPGRSYSSDGYRYGFNGKERDKDMNSLTAYDYGFRIYNPAIGKFLSVDPLTISYPFYTPYQFAGNIPIRYIDLDGLEIGEPGEFWQVFTRPAMGTITADDIAKSKVMNGIVSGLYKSGKRFWNFVTRDAYKKKTWRNVRDFFEEFVVGSAPGIKTNTPIIDSKIQDFKDRVINGNTFSVVEYFTEIGADMLLAKGINKCFTVLEGMTIFEKFAVRMNFVKAKYGEAIEKYRVDHIDFTKAVSEIKLSGTGTANKKLVQWREPGNPNPSPFFSYDDVDPGTLGIPKTYTQKYYVELQGEQTFLQTTANTVKAFAPEKDIGVNGVYNGGGTQVYSTEAAKTAKFIPVNY